MQLSTNDKSDQSLPLPPLTKANYPQATTERNLLTQSTLSQLQNMHSQPIFLGGCGWGWVWVGVGKETIKLPLFRLGWGAKTPVLHFSLNYCK